MAAGHQYKNIIMKDLIKVLNWINGIECSSEEDMWIDKYNPDNGKLIIKVTNSSEIDVNNAVKAAENSFKEWSEFTPVKRGQILSKIVDLMKISASELSENIALEAGKPPQDASGEVGAAIMQGEFFAGEGMRLYGKSLTSGTPGKYSHTTRNPHGIVGLIVPANTPIANIAWKTFPALICGNTIVLKSSEDTPSVAIMFAELAKKAGLPDGVFNVIQGEGSISGEAIVNHPKISLISFTGSTNVGIRIAQNAGKRLARVSLELGGKNALIVCDDADLDEAVHWSSLSAFSNAGQRCAAGSKIFIFENIYDNFVKKFITKAKSLKLGTRPDCDLGPVINQRQYQNIKKSIKTAIEDGGILLCGEDGSLSDIDNEGYYIKPTIISGLNHSAELSNTEIFGPVVTIYPIKNIQEALEYSNSSKYGLTSAIHTKNVDTAMWFAQRVRSGVVNINIGTYGSEPHMPFGGYGLSGNGTREPGSEALDVYSEIKNISFLTRENLI